MEGETLEDLFDGVNGAVVMHKLDVWWKLLLKVTVNHSFLFQIGNNVIINIVVKIAVIYIKFNIFFVSVVINGLLN